MEKAPACAAPQVNTRDHNIGDRRQTTSQNPSLQDGHAHGTRQTRNRERERDGGNNNSSHTTSRRKERKEQSYLRHRQENPTGRNTKNTKPEHPLDMPYWTDATGRGLTNVMTGEPETNEENPEVGEKAVER